MKESGFQVSVLASGSTGNSLYIESPKVKLLVDAGLSGKKIINLLSEVDRKAEDLDGILVTHEHTDHINGVGVLARKFGLDVYANEKTWHAMSPLIGEVPIEQKHIFEMGITKTIGDFDIESFGVSHDAVAPQFYKFNREGKSFVVLTDTGYCSDRVRGLIENANAYLVESNHDIGMLREGPYPWSLKQRILGDRGHLSNEDGALVMCDVIGSNTERVYLGHLSKKNNMKILAHMAMEDVLKEHEIDTENDVIVFDTDPVSSTELFAV